jgi:hypothetical protein
MKQIHGVFCPLFENVYTILQFYNLVNFNAF